VICGRWLILVGCSCYSTNFIMNMVISSVIHLFTLQVGVWIDAGSRHETNTNNGVARLLERLAFTVSVFVTLFARL